MKLQVVENTDYARIVPANDNLPFVAVPFLNQVELLTETNKNEVLELLNLRPVHTIVMTSFINKNGIEGEKNRGKFYGYRNLEGKLEGVALIGHTTLVEARSEEALISFAITAKDSETPIKVMMSDDTSIERFWNYYALKGQKPKHNFTELLFEINFPFTVQKCEWNVRLARPEELLQVAEAHAEIAFIESGINPLKQDREGFLNRCLERINNGKTFVVFEDGKLLFKVDLVAETESTGYLEGYYVNSEVRGKGIGSKCLSHVALNLLDEFENVCGLCNVKFEGVHKSLAKAGFINTDSCQTIFV